jgi:hypothetical protein
MGVPNFQLTKKYIYYYVKSCNIIICQHQCIIINYANLSYIHVFYSFVRCLKDGTKKSEKR